MQRIEPLPGQESVWDYPRPPRVEPETRVVRVILAGEVIVESMNALRVLETSHPPGIYIPPQDVGAGVLRSTSGSSVCEWKGRAAYWDVTVGTTTVEAAAWSYPSPNAGFEAIADHVSFYPGRMEACYLGEELVTPQEGGFYGGWITSEVVGPFKGPLGTWGW